MTISFNDIDAVIPVGVQPMLAQFNKTSNAFITCCSVVPLEYLDTDHFNYVEVEIDVKTQRIEGTYDNFKIVDIASAASIIYESQVNASCRNKIYKRFEPEVQLDILRNVLVTICEKLEITDEAFDDMNAYIDDVKRANKVIKQAYINNPDFKFVTIEEEQAEHEAKLDGGLHELMGPANLVSLGPTTNQ